MLTFIFWSLQSTFQTAFPPSTIADLYSAIASLIKESNSNTAKLIEESEKRQKSYFTAELTKIREEMKAGKKREEMKAREKREEMKAGEKREEINAGEKREEINAGENREEMKVGDTPAKKATEGNLARSKQKNDKVSEEVIYCQPLNLVLI